MTCSRSALLAALLCALPMAPGARAAERHELRDHYFQFVRHGRYGHLLAGGPAAEGMATVWSVALDRQDNLFIVNSVGRIVTVVSREGRLYPLAGTGTAGFRDGPAEQAMFAFGGRGYPYAGIAVDSASNVYVADGYNQRVRKISRRPDGRWAVTSFAGGGTRRLRPGEQASQATAVQLWGPVAVATDAAGNVWFEAGHLYRVTPGGEISCFSVGNDRGVSPLNVVAMASDRVGGVYALNRQNWTSQLWQIIPDGRLRWLAGITESEKNDKDRRKEPTLADGAPAEASIHAASTLAAAPDGSAVYFGGGDETVLRRYKDGRVSSMTGDGTWAELPTRRGGMFTGGPLWVDTAGRIYVARASYTHPEPGQWTAIRALVPLK